MPDYVIEVRYGNGEPSLRIPLAGFSADEAELERQYILQEIEHAREIESPLVLTDLRSGPLEEHLEIPVDGALTVDLLDAQS